MVKKLCRECSIPLYDDEIERGQEYCDACNITIIDLSNEFKQFREN